MVAPRREWPCGRHVGVGGPAAGHGGARAAGGLAQRACRRPGSFFFAFVNDLCVEEFIRCDVKNNLVTWICEINSCYEFVDDL
jgi:hypothetical protein